MFEAFYGISEAIISSLKYPKLCKVLQDKGQASEGFQDDFERETELQKHSKDDVVFTNDERNNTIKQR